MSKPKISKSCFLKAFHELEGENVATETLLNPYDDDELAAYITAYYRWLSDEHFPEVEVYAPHWEMVHDAVFMAGLIMQNAAYQWVQQRFGKDAAEQLESALDEEDTRAALDTAYRAELEKEAE